MIFALGLLLGALELPGTAALAAPYFAGSRGSAIVGLEKWFRSAGGVMERVTIRDVPGEGMGVIATENIEAGSEVVKVPRALCISADDAPAWIKATAGREAPDGADLSLTGTAAIAARLCEEFALGGASPWADYFEALPRPADLAELPVLWPDALADGLLEGTQAGSSRAAHLTRWRQELDAVNRRKTLADRLAGPSAAASGGGGGDTIGWTDWLWASALVMNRAYNLPGLGYAVLPIIDFTNHDDSISHAVVDPPPPLPAGAAGFILDEQGTPEFGAVLLSPIDVEAGAQVCSTCRP